MAAAILKTIRHFGPRIVFERGKETQTPSTVLPKGYPRKQGGREESGRQPSSLARGLESWSKDCGEIHHPGERYCSGDKISGG